MPRIAKLLLFLCGVFSTDLMAQPYQWQLALPVPMTSIEFNPLSRGRILYTSTDADTGIFRSDDGGQTWAQYNQGLEPFSTSNIRQILCISTDTAILLAATPRKVYRSTNGGMNWAEAIEFGGALAEALSYHPGTDVVYYGKNYKGPVHRSTDRGATWVISGAEDTAVALCSIATSPNGGNRLLAGSGDGGIAISDDEGENWRTTFDMEDTSNIFRPEVPRIVYSMQNPNVVFATRWLAKTDQIVRSTDNGETWQTIPFGHTRTWAIDLDQRSSALRDNIPQRIWIGLFNRGADTISINSVVETFDGGKSWLSSGLPKVQQVWMLKFDTTSGRLAAATDSGLYITTAKLGVRPALPQVPGIRLKHDALGRELSVRVANNRVVSAIAILDLVGRELLTSSGDVLSTKSLPLGVYFVQVRCANEMFVEKLVIDR